MDDDKDARTWATICHLSALLMLVGVPVGNILGPLVVWLIKRRVYEFVDDQGKEALNFQITFTLCAMATFIFIFFLMLSANRYLFEVFFPAMLLMIGLIVLNVGLVIIAAIKSNDGILYRYPFSLRFIR